MKHFRVTAHIQTERRNAHLQIRAGFLTLVTLLSLMLPLASLGGKGNLILILDASGSMWGQVEGRTKIEIAREVMAGLVYELPEELNVGLVAYGHRRKGDCSDVEEIRALGPLDKQALAGQIQRLKPKGKTPLSRSVRETAQALKHLEDETTILLVSDGKETCEGDPCALVRELKEAGIKFVLHVIGFDVTVDERKQLQCMADAGGGTYYTAANASEFKQAVETIQRTGHLKVVALRNGAPIPAEVQVTKAGQTVVSGTTTEDRNQPVTFKLDAGQYRITVTEPTIAGLDPVVFDPVEISGGASVERVVEFAVARLRLGATRNGQPAAATFRVTVADRAEPLVNATTTQTEAFWLAPGNVDVEISESGVMHSETIRFKAVALTAGETVERIADFSDGRLQIRANRNGQEIRALVEVLVPEEERDIGTFYTSTDPQQPSEIDLEPGIYTAVVIDESRPGKPEVVFSGLEIAKGRRVEKTADFSDGTLQLIALRNGELIGASVEVIPAGKTEATATDTTSVDLDKPLELILPLARYTLRITDVENPARPTIELTGVEITTSKVNEQVAEFAAAIIELKAVKNKKPVSALASLKALPETKKKTLALKAQQEPKRLFLEPGAYDISIKHGKANQQRQVEFSGVEIALGDTIEKVADFSDGTLYLEATQNGKKRLYAGPSVYDAEGNKVAGHGATSPWKFRLAPGIYSVAVADGDLPGDPVKRVEDIEIKAGQTTKVAVDFSAGYLHFQATENGKHRLYAGPSVYDAEGNKVAGYGATSPWKFTLAPGIYSVAVADGDLPGDPVKRVEDIEIKAGQTTQAAVDFIVGSLHVKITIDGKGLGGMHEIYVYRDGEKESLINLAGYNGKGKFVPGTYDISYWGSNQGKGRFEGIVVEAGKTTVFEKNIITTPQNALSDECQEVYGQWAWFSGSLVTIKSKGIAEINGLQAATWKCDDTNNRLIVIDWPEGWIDTLTLSNDENLLKGSNQYGTNVSATRKQ